MRIHLVTKIAMVLSLLLFACAPARPSKDRPNPAPSKVDTSHANQGVPVGAVSLSVDGVIVVGEHTESVVVGEQGLWVSLLGRLGPSRQTLALFDPESREEIRRLEAGSSGDFTAADGWLWVIDREDGAKVVHKVAEDTGQVAATVPLPSHYAGPILATGHAVWVGIVDPNGGDWKHAERYVLKLDPESGAVIDRIPAEFCGPNDAQCGGDPDFVSAGGYVLARGLEGGRVVRIDEQSGESSEFGVGLRSNLAVGESEVWVQTSRGGKGSRGVGAIVRIDPEAGRIMGDPLHYASSIGGLPRRIHGASPIGVIDGRVIVFGLDDEVSDAIVGVLTEDGSRIGRTTRAGLSYVTDVVLDAENDAVWVVHPYEITKVALHSDLGIAS